MTYLLPNWQNSTKWVSVADSSLFWDRPDHHIGIIAPGFLGIIRPAGAPGSPDLKPFIEANNDMGSFAVTVDIKGQYPLVGPGRPLLIEELHETVGGVVIFGGEDADTLQAFDDEPRAIESRGVVPTPDIGRAEVGQGGLDKPLTGLLGFSHGDFNTRYFLMAELGMTISPPASICSLSFFRSS